MRLTTDFSSSLRLYALGTAAVFGLFVFLSSAYSVLIIYDTWIAYQKTPALNNKLTALKATVDRKQLSQLPAREDMNRLLIRIKNINGLAPGQIMDSGNLIQILEKLTPGRVAYRSIQYDPQKGLLKLSAEAYSAKDLTILLFELEKYQKFGNVILRKQSRQKKHKLSLIRYEISLKVLR